MKTNKHSLLFTLSAIFLAISVMGMIGIGWLLPETHDYFLSIFTFVMSTMVFFLIVTVLMYEKMKKKL